MRRKRTAARLIAGILASVVTLAIPITGLAPTASAASSNLALGKTMTASGYTQTYTPSSANDGNQSSYWESTDNAFPQWLQVDLGGSTAVNQIVLKLPSGWGARTETLSAQGSADGSSFSTLVSSAGYNFDGSANTVTINFGQATTRYVRLNFTANTGWPAGQLSEFEVYGTASAPASANLAQGKTATASSYTQTYVPANGTDGDQSTYWESNNNAFPQWFQVDLGSSVSINKLVLKLPTVNWGARTETLSVQTSTDNSNFSTIVNSAGYNFDGTTNTVTINLSAATTTRYVRLNFTANTGQAGAQLSELEVYGPTTGDTQAPTAPGNLAYTQPQSGQITLTWNSSSDNVGVTGYDIYLNNSLLTTVPSSALTYTDNEPDTLTATYFVRAHDAAGNQSANSNSVTRTAQTGDQQPPTAPTNLAVSTPSSGQVTLTWGAATDNVGVTSYVVYRNGTLDATVSGTTLTYSEAQPATATVMYYVVAKDANGNQSAASNTVTRQGTGGPTTNLALGKPVTGSASTFTFVPTNVNDGDLTTYFEGSTYPSTVTVQLGANADLSSVTVALNPDASWGTRTQTIAVLGREQSSSTFTTLVAAQSYTFNPASGNKVSIPVSGRVADVELSITSNTGAPGGQVAEFQVFGTPAPNPDLTITGSSWTPTSPIETDPVTLSATVKNIGTAASAASNVNLYLGSTKVGTAAVGALAAGAAQTVTANVGTQTAGTYQFTAKVDEANTIIELNDANNNYTNPTSLVVAPVQSSDLVAAAVTWTPNNPAAGNPVAFSVTLKNQGTIASASGAHGITLTVLNSTNGTVTTLTGSYSGSLAPGASAVVSMGSWTAVNGKYTVKTVIAVDANELSVKQANNTATTSLFVGQGANMPYDMYEAEAGTIGGGAAVVGPNRTIGDLAGEASGREAVTLNSTGSFVQWTSREPTNTFVVRFSIPDASGGDGINATLDLYVNGTLVQPLSLTSEYEWLYGDETAPGNSPSAGAPRHIYDEASFVLPATYPQGSTIKLQKDTSNTSQYAIDYMNLEQATAIANPSPASYVVPTGFDQQSVQNALTKAATDTTGTYVGVYLPPGQYQTTGKFQVSGKAIKVVGAGPWFTQFSSPTGQTDTDDGFSVQSSANGSTFTGFAFFGNYTSRIDGPGKVFDLTDVSNLTISNIWIEHTVCGIWGTHVTGLNVSDLRIRDTFADGINLNNGSQNNTVNNSEARSTGDDSFAIFAAQDHNSADLTGNVFENLTSILPWRAASFAIYGGDGNTFENLYSADTLTYSGLTISSLNFGYPFQGFGDNPKTTIQNLSLVRDGGHFWGGQVFGAVWVFSATQPFQGIRVSDLTITGPTYSGIMFQTDYVGGTAVNSVQDTTFTNTTITGAQQSGDAYNAKSGYGIWANPLPESGQGPAVGSATFTG
ncbi:MAG TPA: discoidin domain-containing protein, partial [Pseudonocardiaceae bacterium]|nr:discoidin domain-containing protein [Pseudonocardiaceae bacterium]